MSGQNNQPPQWPPRTAECSDEPDSFPRALGCLMAAFGRYKQCVGLREAARLCMALANVVRGVVERPTGNVLISVHEHKVGSKLTWRIVEDSDSDPTTESVSSGRRG